MCLVFGGVQACGGGLSSFWVLVLVLVRQRIDDLEILVARRR
jgi:hypothetical protein